VQRALEIVVAAIIVLVVVAIAIPSNICTGGGGGSNESAAVANLRTIDTAQVTYKSSSGGSFGTMADLVEVRLLDDTFTGTKAGYNYTITLDGTSSGYTAEAVPALIPKWHAWFSGAAPTKTGRYGYYSVPDAVVRYSTDTSLAPAGQSGRPVQ
jgi:hypothetical protein